MKFAKAAKILTALLAYAAFACLVLFVSGRISGDSTTGTTIRAAAGGILAAGGIQFVRFTIGLLRPDRQRRKPKND
ncbi:hypothetical protein [Kitasatospora cheerisanensis]|uniref:hypothetical protein n=1 Tax=Kitasatospora cheerisanensis TaxID=81942 RepID=UPI0005627719|nr:hypothetical protein [Kitasatospora cheerisanensis]